MSEIMDGTTIGAIFTAAVSAHGDRPFLAVPANDARGYLPTGFEITYGEAGKSVDELAAVYRGAGYGLGHRGGTAYGGYGRTWRGNRFLGGGAAEVVAAGVHLGLSYDSPSAYYEYPDNAYGYNYGVGFGTDALYAYAPRYGVRYRPAPLYDYAPGYSVGATAAPLYNFAPGYVSTVGYARGQSCRCSP